jgi:hypothetical protein
MYEILVKLNTLDEFVPVIPDPIKPPKHPIPLYGIEPPKY